MASRAIQEKRMHELVELLNKAGKAYYNESEEMMSNYEYDALYDELTSLEKELDIVLPNSPTIHVGYEIVSELNKVTHEYPMLSLDKTKEVEALVDWLSDKEGVLSWKEDGLTTVLNYQDGILKQAVTRGNGTIGEDITHNARVFQNVPLSIPYKGKLVLRGESVITYSEFNRINDEIIDADAKYKNPRNLCSGTVRQLNSKICAERNVKFIAFQLVEVNGVEQIETMQQRFEWLKQQGFTVVEYEVVTAKNLSKTVEKFANRIVNNDIPSDGLVLSYNDVAYGLSLGRTAKFPKNSIAFKWKDEIATTTFRSIFWSASRTGLINPVAEFDPVEIEGTTVSRASLHNVSIVESYELGAGDQITVYKANMIIPQLADNLTRSNSIMVPDVCPVCGGTTTIKNDNGVKVLLCENPDCAAKKIKQFAHFVSRDAMNIDGLSEATLEKLIQNGWLHSLADLYHLDRYESEITMLDGFGQKSFDKLMKAIENSRTVSMAAFLYSLGILNVGLSNAKLICKSFNFDFDAVRQATVEELTMIDGVGAVIATSIVDYFANEDYNIKVDALLNEIHFAPEEMIDADAQIFNGITFVITGSLEYYSSRKVLKEEIESLGGKVAGSVSSKTNYLINNDATSNSSKNKKAKELGIEILTEEEYRKMLG